MDYLSTVRLRYTSYLKTHGTEILYDPQFTLHLSGYIFGRNLQLWENSKTSLFIDIVLLVIFFLGFSCEFTTRHIYCTLIVLTFYETDSQILLLSAAIFCRF